MLIFANVAAFNSGGSANLIQNLGLSVQGLVTNVAIFGVVVLVYVYRVGGPIAAGSRIRSANWNWLLTDVCLPLGIPVLVGLVYLSFTWLAELPVTPKPGLVFAELTPWTLCFFSLTILAASIRRVSDANLKLWTGLVWAAISIISVFSAVLTIARSTDCWHPGLRAYSASILLTMLAVYLAHGTTRPARPPA